MRTIAIANQKGRCGKTTTAVNVATALALSGKRVLVVDFDPQAHATAGLGYRPNSLNKTIYDAIVDTTVSMSAVAVRSNVTGLNLFPSNILLSGAEFELSSRYGGESVLRDRLATMNNSYDCCIIDCSPSLSLLTLNALVASDEVLIPIHTRYCALDGLRQLLETIDVVHEKYNHSLRILGVLLTFVETRTRASRQIQRQIRDFFGTLVFKTVIHKAIRLIEAPDAGQSVLTYAPRSKGAVEYNALAAEITNGRTKLATRARQANPVCL